jgi:uncharacterized membrane protein YcjF (UPF0283 family)
MGVLIVIVMILVLFAVVSYVFVEVGDAWKQTKIDSQRQTMSEARHRQQWAEFQAQQKSAQQEKRKQSAADRQQRAADRSFQRQERMRRNDSFKSKRLH